MKKIALVGFVMGILGYAAARMIGKRSSKRLPDRRAAAS
jgi:hypothetical protein